MTSKLATPVAALPGAWRYRVSAGTGRPGVSVLWQGEVASSSFDFCLSVAARAVVRADPFLKCTSMLLGRYDISDENRTISVMIRILLYVLGAFECHQAWELAADPRISVGKKKSAPKNKTVRSNLMVMVLHQVRNWQNWKMQGCCMQFLRLIFVKKLQLQLQGSSPPDPQAPTFQLTFPFLIPMPGHSTLTEEMRIPLRPTPKAGFLHL